LADRRPGSPPSRPHGATEPFVRPAPIETDTGAWLGYRLGPIPSAPLVQTVPPRRCRRARGESYHECRGVARRRLADPVQTGRVPLPEVRYADSDGLDIAYTTYGEGPIDVVLVPGMFAHLELNEEVPYYRPFLRRIPRFARLVAFDRRGSGLSDRSRLGTPEERVDDVRAVMDAVGLERAAVVATADGGPLGLLFAATHPHRASALVLHETTPAMVPELGFPPEAAGNDGRDKLVDVVRASWGDGTMIYALVSGAPDTAEVRARFARWARAIASPRQAAALFESMLRLDVRDALGLIACPTLVVHNERDQFWPLQAATYLAEHIHDARLVTLPFDVHVTWDDSSIDAAIDEVELFLTGRSQPRIAPSRALATVLFTDIVDSTGTAERLGDARWRDVLDRLDRTSLEIIDDYGGRLVRSTGDGVLATFDRPGRAVRAAQTMCRRAEGHGVSIRAGLHTGEVELRGDDIAGLAVHIAARIEAAANPGEVLVSSTVIDLTFGSRLEFEPRGPHTLRGVERRWEVFAAVDR
jgi:class 3 adenylate cyclase